MPGRASASTGHVGFRASGAEFRQTFPILRMGNRFPISIRRRCPLGAAGSRHDVCQRHRRQFGQDALAEVVPVDDPTPLKADPSTRVLRVGFGIALFQNIDPLLPFFDPTFEPRFPALHPPVQVRASEFVLQSLDELETGIGHLWIAVWTSPKANEGFEPKSGSNALPPATRMNPNVPITLALVRREVSRVMVENDLRGFDAFEKAEPTRMVSSDLRTLAKMAITAGCPTPLGDGHPDPK